MMALPAPQPQVQVTALSGQAYPCGGHSQQQQRALHASRASQATASGPVAPPTCRLVDQQSTAQANQFASTNHTGTCNNPDWQQPTRTTHGYARLYSNATPPRGGGGPSQNSSMPRMQATLEPPTASHAMQMYQLAISKTTALPATTYRVQNGSAPGCCWLLLGLAFIHSCHLLVSSSCCYSCCTYPPVKASGRSSCGSGSTVVRLLQHLSWQLQPLSVWSSCRASRQWSSPGLPTACGPPARK